jgi:hypothetical protein
MVEDKLLHPSFVRRRPYLFQVETPTGTTTYRTEDEIFDHLAHHLSLRFRHAFSAPIYTSSLLQKLGPLGDTDCAQEILDGTFAYPPDTDLWTTKFFEEAHHTYAMLGNEAIDTAISVADFQGFWQRADENKSSSFSGGHYGLYKAASFDKHLSAFHAAKLTACARKGVVLARWMVGLTVLLEKTPGNNKIHKMRGIVLVEGDFNYYMKEVLARRMLKSKKGSNCISAVMTKICFAMNPEPTIIPHATVATISRTAMTGWPILRQVLLFKALAYLDRRSVSS